MFDGCWLLILGLIADVVGTRVFGVWWLPSCNAAACLFVLLLPAFRPAAAAFVFSAAATFVLCCCLLPAFVLCCCCFCARPADAAPIAAAALSVGAYGPSHRRSLLVAGVMVAGY